MKRFICALPLATGSYLNIHAKTNVAKTIANASNLDPSMFLHRSQLNSIPLPGSFIPALVGFGRQATIDPVQRSNRYGPSAPAISHRNATKIATAMTTAPMIIAHALLTPMCLSSLPAKPNDLPESLIDVFRS